MTPNADIPVTATGLVERGMTLHRQADTDGARQCYVQAVHLDPSNVQAHYLCALMAVQDRDFALASSHLQTACALDPAHAPAALLRGHVLNQLDEPENALASLDVAEALMPGNALVWDYRAQAMISLQRYNEALICGGRALLYAPGKPSALFVCATSLIMLSRIGEAAPNFEQFLAVSPDPAHAHNLIARMQVVSLDLCPTDAGTLRSALTHANTAIALQPGMAGAHEARAMVLERMGDPEGALASYRQALQLDPTVNDVSYGIGRCLLCLGDWPDGWRALERRWLRPHTRALCRDTGAPLWRGESLAGKSIALIAERGFGDMIQFFRFVEQVRSLAVSVTVMVPPALQRLLTPEAAGDVAQSGPFDYHCPFMSLPTVLGTTPSTVPCSQGYLQADPVLAAAWRRRLGATTRLRVGLAWRGDPAHGNDHNRSMALAQFTQLLEVDGVDFVSLQQIMRDEDRPAHACVPQLGFHGAQLQDFADTAALCEAMDLVISVDTSVAHLAGALGKRLWLLLPAVAEYRWMREREDTPWYARARLFRQPRPGDWETVIGRVRTNLQALLDERELTASAVTS